MLKTVSESGRYACEVCGQHFCIDCDVFAHEVVHNCPGCQSDARDVEKRRRGQGENGLEEPQKGAGMEGIDGDGKGGLYAASPRRMDLD